MPAKPFWNKLSSLIMLFVLMASLVGSAHVQAHAIPGAPPSGQLTPEVRYALKHDISPALRLMQPVGPYKAQQAAPARLLLPKTTRAEAQPGNEIDPALQSRPALAAMPATEFNFEGINNINGVLPPDTNGDVGPNHYVQWVNLSLAVWQLDRATHQATLVYGPVAGNTLWSGFGGACQNSNDGDPIVLYDHLADRWFVSQFAIPSNSGPFYQCIAVSQTPDPTGAWYRYAFVVSNSKMNDYPHFGVWPDGYYMSVNQFAANTFSWAGAAAVVYERQKMLLGQSARQIYFDLESVNPNFGGMLPSDLDGPPPPAGTPNYFAEVDDSSWIGPSDAMRVWEFHADWNNTNNASFGLSGNPNAVLGIDNFNPLSSNIPQPDTSQQLDNLADRLMHRLQYRYFGTLATLVTNHTVNAGGSRAAVRWYEARLVNGSWSIHQQGTYAGDGSNSRHRWMGSAAMDRAGNIAIGYSLSSDQIYPSIAYSGRLVGDPLGTLPQGETTLMSGSGSQLHSAGRWGDYSMLAVDPTDDCTFWFTSEYLQVTSSSSWRTRIGSFTFPSCLAGQSGNLQGVVSSDGTPLAAASVSAGGFSTQTDNAGFYQISAMPVGTYTVTVSAYGYQLALEPDVPINFNQTTTRNYDLVQLPTAIVSGTVADGSGHGWPLYARIDISAPGAAFTTFSDPLSGFYQVSLPQDTPHTFDIAAVISGYLPLTTVFTPTAAAQTKDFAVQVDASACSAPGYADTGTCTPQSGGLLAGNVYDANNSAALNGATVSSISQPGETTTTFATPDDPTRDDGFFILFSSLTGAHDFAAAATNYTSISQTVAIISDSITSASFNLPAGRLKVVPGRLDAAPVVPQIVTETLVISNTGSSPATFVLNEANVLLQNPLPDGPFATPTRHASPKHMGDLTAAAVYEYNPPATKALPGGQVLGQWPTGLAHPWGIGYDTYNENLWVGDVAIDGGDDHLHNFLADGNPAGLEVDTTPTGANFAADMAFDPYTRTFWQANVGAGNCLVEIDPQSLALTGKQICPLFDNSQRGLAFNPISQSFYSGSWVDGIIYHFDRQGTILESYNLNLNIAGLAFNPQTEHLFVLSNADKGFDIYVVDAGKGYTVSGGFDIPAMGDFEQGGLSLACNGTLWAVNQNSGEVFAVASGEAATCTNSDVPWLLAAPMNGVIPAGGAQTIQVVFDDSTAQVGLNSASLVMTNDTPYGIQTIPVTFDVPNFYDVLVSPVADAQSSDVGTSISYTLTVTNNSEISDIYNVTTSGNTWTVIVPPQIGPLLPGQSTPVQVSVSVPDLIFDGASDSVTVQFTSLSNPAISASATLTTTAHARYPIYLPALGR